MSYPSINPYFLLSILKGTEQSEARDSKFQMCQFHVWIRSTYKPLKCSFFFARIPLLIL